MGRRRPGRARRPLRILHIITGLGVGGAERMLLRLVERLPSTRFSCAVVSLLPERETARALRALSVPTGSLGLRPRVPDPRGLFRLARLLRRLQPDVVQTWMYHADLLGGLAARAAGVRPIVWSLRASRLSHKETSLPTRATIAACARLSRTLPDRIIACSKAVLEDHLALGYPEERLVLIPNGFDTERFSPSATRRREVRQGLSLDDDALLLAYPARVTPQKDHPTCLDALRLLLDEGRDVTLVLCGEGAVPANGKLVQWIRKRRLEGAVRLLGVRDDMERLLPAVDVVLSSSAFGEGIPNALGEALAAGVPCVATNVGDSAEIVGDAGFLVPPRDPRALARAVAALLDEGEAARRARGARGREHVAAHFSLDACVRRYAQLYEELADHVRHRRHP